MIMKESSRLYLKNTLYFKVVALTALFLFSLPITLNWEICDYENIESFPLHHALSSMEFTTSIYCSIAISLPMLLELILRIILNPASIFEYKSVISNIALISSLLIPDVLLLAYVVPNKDLIVLNIVTNARLVLLLWTTMTFLDFYGGPIWKMKLTKISFTILVVHQLVDFYGVYFDQLIPPINASLGFFGLFLFYYQAQLWFREFYKLSKQQKLTTDLYLSNIYVISSCITMIAICIVFLSKRLQSWLYFTGKDLAAYTYADTIFYLMMFAMQGSALHREATLSQNMLSVKRTFFRYMSHEMRTPLNTVIMGLQYLEEDMIKRGDSTLRRQTLTDIKESCDIAIKTLNDMLIYDKIETGGLVLDKVDVNIVDLVKETTKPFKIQADQSGVTLEVAYVHSEEEKDITSLEEHPPLMVSADTSKIAQVIRNITSNALKFTPTGGHVSIRISKYPTTTVTTTTTGITRRLTPPAAPLLSSSLLPNPSSSNMQPLSQPRTSDGTHNATKNCSSIVRIEVTDTGHGISEENQSKLFHGIIQFSPGKLQAGGGSGLGLYISKGIMNSHEGTLSVYSKGEGYGSTFTMELPMMGSSSHTVLPVLLPPVHPSVLPSTSTSTSPGPEAPSSSTPSFFHRLLTFRRNTPLGIIPNYHQYQHQYFPNSKLPINTVTIHPAKVETINNKIFDKVEYYSSSIYEEKDNSIYKANTNSNKPVESLPRNHLTKKPSQIITTTPVLTPAPTAAKSGKLIASEIYRDCSLRSYNSEEDLPMDSSGGEDMVVGRRQGVTQPKVNTLTNELYSQRINNAITNPEIIPKDNLIATTSVLLSSRIRREDSRTSLTQHNGGGKYKMLVVDDVAMNRKMLIRLLGDRCSSIEEATNGLEALNTVREAMRTDRVIDIITMDYQMPVMDGPTATRKIRDIGFRGLILGITGNALPTDMTTFLIHGANRVLVKPLDIKAFDQTVIELLRGSLNGKKSSSYYRYFPLSNNKEGNPELVKATK